MFRFLLPMALLMLSAAVQAKGLKSLSCATLFLLQGGFAAKVSPELIAKINYGDVSKSGWNPATKSYTGTVIGGHNAAILNDPNYKVQVLGQNSDGSIRVKYQARLQADTGEYFWSNIKTSTLAPESWSEQKITQAILETSLSKPVYSSAQDGSTFYIRVIDGVEWEVITRDNHITAAYPTGGRPKWQSVRERDLAADRATDKTPDKDPDKAPENAPENAPDKTDTSF